MLASISTTVSFAQHSVSCDTQDAQATIDVDIRVVPALNVSELS
jgi:hypothetical protein